MDKGLGIFLVWLFYMVFGLSGVIATSGVERYVLLFVFTGIGIYLTELIVRRF